MGSPEKACFHCGEPIPDGVDLTVSVDGTERAMCCAGCQAVTQLIFGSGLGRYYQFRQELGRQAGEDMAAEAEAWRGCDERESLWGTELDGGRRELLLQTEGIRCAACAWLIRRFIDPQARILWLASPGDCPADALGFDFDGAIFSHVGSRVTFEVLAASFGLEQPAIARLGLLVHYLDVGGVQPPEATGIESVLAGLRETLTQDDQLLTAASAIFDGLLASFDKGETGQQTVKNEIGRAVQKECRDR